MIKPTLAVCCLALAWGCAEAPNDLDPGADDNSDGKADSVASDELYAPTNLPRFDLTLPPASIAALKATPREYAKGTLRYGDETVANVGVALKGNRSFRTLDQKPAFKIKFDAFVAGQTFRGLKRMTLNNAVGDASFIAERLAYTVIRRAGVPAPRANNAVVTVNGQPYGVYVNVEALDKRFLKRWFDSDEGNLYESEFVDLAPGSVDAFELKTNEEENDRTDLETLVAAMTTVPAATMLAGLEPYLDTREFLRFSALEAVLNQWDGYAYYGEISPNNFQLYHDPSTGKFSFLPWGMDATLKRRFGLTGADHVDVWGVHSWLLLRCTSDPGCAGEYGKALTEIATLFESLKLDREAKRMADQIRTAVRADRRKEIDNAAFEAAVTTVVEIIRAQPAKVRADVAGR